MLIEPELQVMRTETLDGWDQAVLRDGGRGLVVLDVRQMQVASAAYVSAQRAWSTPWSGVVSQGEGGGRICIFDHASEPIDFGRTLLAVGEEASSGYIARAEPANDRDIEPTRPTPDP